MLEQDKWTVKDCDSHFVDLLRDTMALDPRPVSMKKRWPVAECREQGRDFAFRLLDYEVQWCVSQTQQLVVTEVRPTSRPADVPIAIGKKRVEDAQDCM